MKKDNRFNVGDRVRAKRTSMLSGEGVITRVVKGGSHLGFPWEDDTPHYEFVDEKTSVAIIAHPRSLERV